MSDSGEERHVFLEIEMNGNISLEDDGLMLRLRLCSEEQLVKLMGAIITDGLPPDTLAAAVAEVVERGLATQLEKWLRDHCASFLMSEFGKQFSEQGEPDEPKEVN
jgi:hypothetical protein